jgi:hypothetical protein
MTHIQMLDAFLEAALNREGLLSDIFLKKEKSTDGDCMGTLHRELCL